jgi:hypothetical protein
MEVIFALRKVEQGPRDVACPSGDRESTNILGLFPEPDAASALEFKGGGGRRLESGWVRGPFHGRADGEGQSDGHEFRSARAPGGLVRGQTHCDGKFNNSNVILAFLSLFQMVVGPVSIRVATFLGEKPTFLQGRKRGRR